ncbi:MAG: D-glycero-beta-D-manno-heptose 1,7-bisphosphate 7-phosphatase [Woeseiaceae bacterium]|nr:D-glycero-beta-D-manno-heptose 1,7-bisphosphate 7-phosphatase [Woeseiaceae bacterium]
MSVRLVILDRDGVINHDSDEFVKTPAEWLPIDGSIGAIASLSKAGFAVAVATNQSGVGRKLIEPAALDAMHDKLRALVKEAGGSVERIAYCPHLPDDGCDCRKPAPGLYRELSREFGIPLDGVPVVGDSERDLQAARAVNARPILVLTGYGEKTAATLQQRGDSVETFADLEAAAAQLIAEMGEKDS